MILIKLVPPPSRVFVMLPTDHLLLMFTEQRTCELGNHYATMEKELIQLRLDLEAEKLKNACLKTEKRALGGNARCPNAF